MLVLVLWSAGYGSGCGCEGDNGEKPDGSVGPERDSSLDAETDLDRDGAGLDSGRDASDASDANSSCPPGETPVDLVPVQHGGEGAPCGAGCRQITWDPRGTSSYDVREASLAYTSNDDVTVGFVDLATGTETSVPVDDPEGEVLDLWGPIAVDGTVLVYSTYLKDGSKRGRLWRIDVATRCRRLLRELQSPGGASFDVARDLDLDGTALVWRDERLGQAGQDAFSYNLASGVEAQLTSYGCCVGDIRIWGEHLVFQGWHDGPYGIFAMDFPAGEPARVWVDPHEQYHPALQGDRVVFTYQGSRPEYELDIHGADLSTGEHFVITEQDGDQCWPDVYDDLVVWQDQRSTPENSCFAAVGSESTDIYGKDLSTGEELVVTTLAGSQSRPRIWERTVFFTYRAPEADDRLQVYAQELP